MKEEEIINKISEKFPAAFVLESKLDVPDPFIKINPDSLVEILKFLRDEPQLSFDFLQNMCAVDMMGYGEKTDFLCIYHLFSYKLKHSIVVKVSLPREDAQIDSVSSLYPCANWYEREAFDFFGIKFKNHPELRRILLPPEWEGHPLRKDYKEGEFALGITTRRENPLNIKK